ncbi:MAG TPA: DUF1844 domain-containing protein [Methylomirabilota bacterium]|jgi:hypothetical protein
MSDSEDSFKVTDRRRRDDAEDATAPTASRSAEPTASRSAETPASRPSEATAESGADRSLAGLFMMLASSAVVGMGAAPDPLTGHVRRDLEQATDAIELLILLREKTQGNRTPEETRILDQIIYDLQVRYVSARKLAG